MYKQVKGVLSWSGDAYNTKLGLEPLELDPNPDIPSCLEI